MSERNFSTTFALLIDSVSAKRFSVKTVASILSLVEVVPSALVALNIFTDLRDQKTLVLELTETGIHWFLSSLSKAWMSEIFVGITVPFL